ncbi:MAG: super-infection exclusion protein B [bacterium]|nr:super-infection exclusion protein B [bacterium]
MSFLEASLETVRDILKSWILSLAAATALWLGLTYFKVPESSKWFVGTLALFFSIVFSLQLGKWMYDIFKRLRQRSATIEYLSALSDKEVVVLGGCVRDNRRDAEIHKYEPAAESLTHKGLLDPATKQQEESLMHSYVIPMFVWKELQHRKDELLSRSEAINARRAQEDQARKEERRISDQQRENDRYRRRW